jgi:hypothetical protein|tara:strand:- start:15074 stop:15328 length:255 start_codon:yes stop_codon:yes gene_type:complete
MSTTLLWQAAAAIKESVDLPAPGIPTRTMDARESKIRRPSVGDAGGPGVIARARGEERTLEGAESSRMVVNVRFVPIVAEGMAV